MESLCQCVNVGRQAYYQDKYRSSKRVEYEHRVVELIKEFRLEQPSAGIKKLQVDINIRLVEQEHNPIGRDRLFEIAARNGLLVARRKSRQPVTTYSKHGYAVQPNRIKDEVPTAPGQILVADITYLSLCGGQHAYLSLVTDKYSRYIVGYYLSKNLSNEGALKAIEMASKNLPRDAKAICHSDRGVQYCCHDYLDKLNELGIISSMTDADHCAQNALAERVNGILKSEFYLDITFNNFAIAQRAVDNAIRIYNTRRRHWSLKLRTPADVHFEDQRLAA
jgi:putative transposase